MDNQAAKLIDEHGGTTVVAKAMNAPVSTVHSWRTIGMPSSRREHFALLVQIGRLQPVPAEAA